MTKIPANMIAHSMPCFDFLASGFVGRGRGGGNLAGGGEERYGVDLQGNIEYRWSVPNIDGIVRSRFHEFVP